ncbi:10285_t:CDS:10 [Dentiscutata heterogama]|uniref:10285_t:CDS:1 n=1 Tax=Dentiscutata heterogama TaxID=1316150 RepID=A0ACA9K492_9GLOM|nr:10285_t:CDS:10 [Dentiscutata heterogama]
MAILSLIENIDLLTLLVLVSLGLATYVAQFYFNYFTRKNPLPGPVPWPIIGVWENDIAMANKFQEKYGDIWEVWKWSERHIWIGRADLATKLLNPSYSNNNFPFRTTKNEGLDLMDMTSKGVVFNLDWNSWNFNRKCVNRVLMSPKFLRHSVVYTQNLFTEMEKHWLSLGLDKEIDLAKWMMRFMMDSTLIMTTNKNFYALANYYDTFSNSKCSNHILKDSERFVAAIRTHFIACAFFKDTPKYKRRFFPNLRRQAKELLEEVAWLNREVLKIIRERKQEIDRTPLEDELSSDMLTMLLTLNTSRDINRETAAEPISEDDVRAIVYDIIGGGSDTGIYKSDVPIYKSSETKFIQLPSTEYMETSNTFCYVVYYLSHYHEVRKAMLKELETVLGNDQITYEKLQKLHYCDAIIKEVFRTMPTVPVLLRVNSKPDEIDGHHFESSTMFMINVPGVHMHSAHWDNPQKFDPQRFMDKNIEGNIFIPFGGGAKICPGKQLSMLQMKALIVLLYRKYDVELVDMNAPINVIRVNKKGLGDCGDGISPAFLGLSKMLGHVKFVFPNAPSRPITVNNGMVMPAWYDIDSLGENIEDRNEDEEGMLNSVRGLNGIIRDEVDSGIPSNRIVVGGFSQGSAMSLLVGLTSEYRFAGIAVGYLPLRNKIFKMATDSNKGTPIFMAHGIIDAIIPYNFGKLSYEFLNSKGYRVNFKTYNTLSHSINAEELRDFAQFLKDVIPDV